MSETHSEYKKFITQCGQALVEFALVLPLLILILMGVFDLGQGVYAYNVVSSAAREGARYGTTNPSDVGGIQSQAKANTVGLDPSQMTVSVNCSISGCPPATSTITVMVTYTWQPLTLFFTPLTLTGKSTMVVE